MPDSNPEPASNFAHLDGAPPLPPVSAVLPDQQESRHSAALRVVRSSARGVSNWNEVERVYTTNFDKPDMQAVRAVYAAFAAHPLAGQPVWPLLVGPPGSLKTVLLTSLDGLPETYIIDQLTPKTFISGYRPNDEEGEEQPSGLLFRIGDTGKIICPDFSTILAINREHRASILSDFRRIYDGCLRKEFGTGGNMKEREWRGRITFMAAGTGDVDRHYSLFSSLGERFLLIRWPRSGMEAAQRAVTQDMKVVQQQVCDAVRSLLSGLEGQNPAVPSEMEQNRIPALGDFIAYCRTPVVRNSRGAREIIDVPEAESATRISQQLCQLAKGSAALDRRVVVNEQDYAMVVRVAFDCMLPARRKVLSAILPSEVLPGAFAQDASMPDTTRRYAMEDLVALGVLHELEHDILSERSIFQLDKAGLI